MSEVADIVDYEAQIEDLQRHRNWIDMIRLCTRIRKGLETTHREATRGTVTHYRLLSAVYMHLARGYSMIGEHRKCVTSARKSITTLVKADPDPVDTHFGYLALARYHEQFGDLTAARLALVRSLTCIVTKRQSEFIACSLTDLYSLGRHQGDVTSDINHLARQIRTERRWASADAQQVR